MPDYKRSKLPDYKKSQLTDYKRMAGVPGMNSGGTKKPFTYCPGGINFNELKSPKMARRIAKHQSQIQETQTLPPKGVNADNNPQVCKIIWGRFNF